MTGPCRLSVMQASQMLRAPTAPPADRRQTSSADDLRDSAASCCSGGSALQRRHARKCFGFKSAANSLAGCCRDCCFGCQHGSVAAAVLSCGCDVWVRYPVRAHVNYRRWGLTARRQMTCQRRPSCTWQHHPSCGSRCVHAVSQTLSRLEDGPSTHTTARGDCGRPPGVRLGRQTKRTVQQLVRMQH